MGGTRWNKVFRAYKVDRMITDGVLKHSINFPGARQRFLVWSVCDSVLLVCRAVTRNNFINNLIELINFRDAGDRKLIFG